MKSRTSTMKALRAAIMLAFALTSFIGTMPRASAARERGYQIIVHPSNPVSELDKSSLARIFQKRLTRWPETGVGIRPVDQVSEAPVRHRFTEGVLGRSVGAMRNFWQQMIFSGRDVPPPELDGDDAVVRYVLENPGAIGYISPSASPGDAKVVAIQ